jgi:hypothetical protein
MSGLFSSDQPVQAATPTTVPSAPSRSSSEVEALAERQRKKFSAAGSFTKNYFTGGDAGEVSTTTRVLGGGGI